MKRSLTLLALCLLTYLPLRAQTVPVGGTASAQPPNIGSGAVHSGDSALGVAPIPGTGVPGTPTPDAPTLRVNIPEKAHPHGKRKSDEKFDPKG